VPVGTAYYVTTTGNDTAGNGSAASPWGTIQKAANTVPAGASVHVAAGTYNERVTIPTSRSGAAGAPTRFIADGAVVVSQGFVVPSSYVYLSGFEVTPGSQTGDDGIGQVHVTGSHNTFTGFSIHDVPRSGFSFHPSSSYCTVDDFTITNTSYGAGIQLSDRERGAGTYAYGTANTRLYGANNITITNGTIAHAGGGAAINMYGDNHLVENVEIIGGPSGAPNDGLKDGDGIRVNYSSGTTLRNVRIQNLWEWYTTTHHTDGLQSYIEVYDLLIDGCKFGTWQTNSGSSRPTCTGPTQHMMLGTVYANSHLGITIQNCLFLGNGSNWASIVTAVQSGATIDLTLLNNTFTGTGPSFNSASTVYARNNVYGNFNIYPTNKSGVDSDYNCFLNTCSGNAFANEGPHSIGKSFGTGPTKAAAFTNPDITATGGWGRSADWTPKVGGALVGSGDAAAGHYTETDITGTSRGTDPDIGAYE
jgi:hypothetical protein